MTPPPKTTTSKLSAPQVLLRDWSSARLSAVVEAAYLLEVATR